jgi:hypothetical protein
MISTSEVLLFDILTEIKELKDLLIKEESKAPEVKAEGLFCKYCEGTHDNKGQILACAKKNKKGR